MRWEKRKASQRGPTAYLEESQQEGLGCPGKHPFPWQRGLPSAPPPIAGTPPSAWPRRSPLSYQREEEAEPRVSQDTCTHVLHSSMALRKNSL